MEKYKTLIEDVIENIKKELKEEYKLRDADIMLVCANVMCSCIKNEDSEQEADDMADMFFDLIREEYREFFGQNFDDGYNGSDEVLLEP